MKCYPAEPQQLHHSWLYTLLSMENMASGWIFIETTLQMEVSMKREISWWNQKHLRWQHLPSIWVRGIVKWWRLSSCSCNVCWSRSGGYLVQQYITKGYYSATQQKYFWQKAARGLSWLLIFPGWPCASFCHAQAAWQRGCYTARNEEGEGEVWGCWCGDCFPSGIAGAWRQGSKPWPHRELHWCHLVALTQKEPRHCAQFPLWRQPLWE